ncbi:Nudix family hydrolase [uncultured Endozoicomonas sp.]|uniref:Nudix family hydrolase n=1 Tax=uncultured Endozoicomonas sp. TaxID=432652 RepID=UPI002635DFEF|nr:Nudix family hydrolase [uncultured Endozoicomonas sp.]
MLNIEPEIANKKIIHVAVGVILGDDGRILLAKRPNSKHMGGLWEFPGGKVEPGELVTEALKRELREELAIEVERFKPLICLRHDYPDRTVRLDAWIVRGITGCARGNERQIIEWVEASRLDEYEFPEANKAILRAFTLPDRYMITGHFDEKVELFQKVSAALDKGIRLIQFRAPWLERNVYLDMARELSERVKAQSGTLLIKGDLALLQESWCHGLHLTTRQLDECTDYPKEHNGKLLAASCHDERQVKRAQALGMDFITVSPVNKTRSHPETAPLGHEMAEQLTVCAALPVYWLGGMDEVDIDVAQSKGAQGVAAIHAIWVFL